VWHRRLALLTAAFLLMSVSLEDLADAFADVQAIGQQNQPMTVNEVKKKPLHRSTVTHAQYRTLPRPHPSVRKPVAACASADKLLSFVLFVYVCMYVCVCVCVCVRGTAGDGGPL
jgi:hypothetical protein